MKLTIIADDKFISKDGLGIGGLTLKDFPSDVWAVQWDGSKGTVEKRDLSVTQITDIAPYNAWVTEYDTALTTIRAQRATVEDLREDDELPLEGEILYKKIRGKGIIVKGQIPYFNIKDSDRVNFVKTYL